MKKLVVAILGGTVVLLGLAMIILPGPAVLVIPAGLAILATGFLWARRAGQPWRGKVGDNRSARGQLRMARHQVLSRLNVYPGRVWSALTTEVTRHIRGRSGGISPGPWFRFGYRHRPQQLPFQPIEPLQVVQQAGFGIFTGVI